MRLGILHLLLTMQLFSYCCLLTSGQAFAQSKIDSLKTELASAAADSNKVNILNKLCWGLKYSEPNQALIYCEEALNLGQQITFKEGEVRTRYNLGGLKILQGKFDEAITQFSRSGELAEKLGLANRVAIAKGGIGLAHANQGNFTEAIKEMTEALDWYKKADAAALPLAKLYLNLGLAYSNNNQVVKALDHYLLAYKGFQESNHPTGIASACNNIASINIGLGKFEEVFPYLETAIEVAKEHKLKRVLSMAYNNMGNSYLELKNLDKALNYYEQSLVIKEEIKDLKGQAMNHAHIGKVQLEKGNYSLARENLDKSIKLCQEHKIKLVQPIVFKYLGQHAYQTNHYEEALQFFQQAIKEGFEIGHIDTVKDAYLGLRDTYQAQNRHKEALDAYEQHIVYRDSILGKEHKNKIEELEAVYKNEQLKQENEIQALQITQADISRRWLMGISSLVFLLALLSFLFYQNRQKSKKREAEMILQMEKAEADKLRQMDRLKSNFFANISHEFRTPLTLILGPLDDMRKGIFKGNQEKYYNIMYRNGKRLQDLINQLLDLSKLESNKMSLQLEEGDVFKYLRSLAQLFESWADRKHIDYQIHIPKAPLQVLFDKDKLEKIVVNLLSNAFKFTPEEGRITISVDQQTAKTDQHYTLLLKVSDTGYGLDKAQLPVLFDRFYQSTLAADQQASSGIGLALTKELVELHKGQISVESQKEKGSIFSISLPLAKASQEQKVLDSEEHLTISTLPADLVSTNQLSEKASLIQARPLANEKHLPILLLVEDNADVRQFIKDLLVSDYQVIEAKDGEEGLEKAIATIPDLIISDVMMPKMGGVEMTDRLKKDERTSHIPIILLTAKAEQADKLEGLETGADNYLTKPFDSEELLVRIRKLIEQRRQLRQRFQKQSQLMPKEIAVTSVDEAFLNRLMTLVEEHIDDEEFTIEEMGRFVNMSRSQLYRKIKALTDKSPSVFLRTIRLQRARHLLEQQAGNTTEVAFMVGFSNLSYFSKCYKDEFGYAPTHQSR